MRKPILLGAVIATAIVISAGVLAGYAVWKSPAFAEVVSVEPVKQAVIVPEKVCRDKKVVRRKPVQDAPGNVDAVVGGTVRGRVAQTVGTGTGGVVVTGKGAVAASNDNELRQKGQEKVAEKVTVTERHCSTALRQSETVVAYDVRYRLHGKTSKVRMDHDPGKRIPVRNGQLVLTGDSMDGSGFRG